MKLRKKTMALLLFSAAFMCSIGVSAYVLWQTDALRLQENQPVASDNVQSDRLYPAMGENGLWGYIDGEGSWQVEPGFAEACCFEGKAAWVKEGELWGAIGADGAYIVEPEFGRIEVYADGSSRFIAAFESVNSTQAQNSALFDINGQKLFGLAGELRAPSSGLMAFSRQKGDVTSWGYINPHGEIIIEPIYAKVGQAAGNYALVKEFGGGTLLLNIYAKTGTAFEGAFGLNSVGSRLILSKDEESGLFGYVDVDGNLQIDYTLVVAEAFRGGAALAAEPKTSGTSGDFIRWGLLTADGVWAVEPEYLSGEYLDNGLYALKLDGEAGYLIVNAMGESLFDDVVYGYEDWQQGYLACHLQDKTCFLTVVGEVAEQEVALQQGAILAGNLWGYMDDLGATWYKLGDDPVSSEPIFVGGHERDLSENLRLVSCVERSSGAFLVSYPQIEAIDGEPGSNWRRLNLALSEQAVDDYAADYADNDEVNFTVRGEYELLRQGEVLTVCQRMSLDDSWQPEGCVERVVHTVCFDAVSGRQYRLSDLFKDEANWRSKLLEPLTVSYELSAAAKGEVVLVEVMELLEKRLSRNVDFACDEVGLMLYFALSDGGVVEIPVLYADIEDMIDKEGAMWQAMAVGAEQ